LFKDRESGQLRIASQEETKSAASEERNSDASSDGLESQESRNYASTQLIEPRGQQLDAI
jgi:hypothetical protein